jgi:hypothetical protein
VWHGYIPSSLVPAPAMCRPLIWRRWLRNDTSPDNACALLTHTHTHIHTHAHAHAYAHAHAHTHAHTHAHAGINANRGTVCVGWRVDNCSSECIYAVAAACVDWRLHVSRRQRVGRDIAHGMHELLLLLLHCCSLLGQRRRRLSLCFGKRCRRLKLDRRSKVLR